MTPEPAAVVAAQAMLQEFYRRTVDPTWTWESNRSSDRIKLAEAIATYAAAQRQAVERDRDTAIGMLNKTVAERDALNNRYGVDTIKLLDDLTASEAAREQAKEFNDRALACLRTLHDQCFSTTLYDADAYHDAMMEARAILTLTPGAAAPNAG